MEIYVSLIDFMCFNIFRYKMNVEVLWELIIFVKRIIGLEVVWIKMVDVIVVELDLIFKSKSVGFEVLGSNVI